MTSEGVVNAEKKSMEYQSDNERRRKTERGSAQWVGSYEARLPEQIPEDQSTVDLKTIPLWICRFRLGSNPHFGRVQLKLPAWFTGREFEVTLERTLCHSRLRESRLLKDSRPPAPRLRRDKLRGGDGLRQLQRINLPDSRSLPAPGFNSLAGYLLWIA